MLETPEEKPAVGNNFHNSTTRKTQNVLAAIKNLLLNAAENSTESDISAPGLPWVTNTGVQHEVHSKAMQPEASHTLQQGKPQGMYSLCSVYVSAVNTTHAKTWEE